MTNRLKEKYTNEVVPALTEQFNYTSIMAVPKVDKIVINMGVGDAVNNSKNLDKAVAELALISGQKPLITKAKKSVAAFRLREGMPIGAKVTLRGERMFEFLDKLVTVSLPRVRDFHGVSNKAFDGRGNYTLGVKEQLIFPEINYDDVDKVRGMDIVIVTTANTDEESRELLAKLACRSLNKIGRIHKWLRNLWLLKTNALQNSQHKLILVANVADVHIQFTANLNFAVSVFANWLTKVNCQALKKLHGNLLIIV